MEAESISASDALRVALRVSRPPPRLTVSAWADAERRLSPESSSEPGRWKTARAEYQRGIMDAISDRSVAQVVVMSSAQVGKTEILNNAVGYYIAQDASPILLVQPTLEMAEAWSKDRLAPMVRDTPQLTSLVADPKSKGSGNTLLHKTFPGGHITIAGANSAPSLASRPIRVVLLDEVDRYPASAGTEGDPVSLAIKRTATFWNRRVVLTSTPTVKGASRIEQAFEQSDKRRYFMPCPHCGAVQYFKWANVKWQNNEPDTARILCEDCGALLDDSDRIEMIAAGEWLPTAKFNGIAGFHLWEALSPWRSLAEIVNDFLLARPYPETLRAWINLSLGECWEDQAGERIAGETLASRAGGYETYTVPERAGILTAGVDVQHDRLVVGLWAYGEHEEAFAVAHETIYGTPAEAAVWRALDELIARRLPHGAGTLPIAAVAVDAGDGTTTNFVLDYCRSFIGRRDTPRRLAVKGQSQPNKPPIGKPARVDVTLRGIVARRSALLWPVGSDTVKHWLYMRLRTELVKFPSGMPPEFFEQLTAERIATKFIRGVPRREWVKSANARNEALDCAVYAYAAAVYCGLKRTDWRARRERKTQTEAAAGDASPPAPAAAAEPGQENTPPRGKAAHPFDPMRRPGGGFVNRW